MDDTDQPPPATSADFGSPESELPPPTGAPVTESAAPDHVRPRWAPLTLVAWVGLVICTNVASSIWPRLIDADDPRPELLLLLSSRNRWLVLALGSDVSIPAYAVIGFVRIGLAFVVCHLIGRAYHDVAIGWFKRYLGFTDEAERAFDRGFAKAEWALIPIFAGSNIVGVLTGVRQTPWPKLVRLLSIGIAARLALMWWLERVFEDEVSSFIDFTTRYQWWFIIGSVALVVLVNAKNFQRR